MHRPPEDADIRAALDRVIASAGFRASPQLAVFLRHIVETTLRGEKDRIKAYTIGVDALGRGRDFDPQKDPIVRVEANRLRQALQAYYAGAGDGDDVVIEIPRGRYVPSFSRRPHAAEPPAAASARRRWRPRPAIVVAAVVGLSCVAAAGLAWRGWRSEMPAPPPVGLLQIAVLEIEPVQVDSPRSDPLAAATNVELAKALSHIQSISVVFEADRPRDGARDAGLLRGFKLAGRLDAAADGSGNLTLRLEYDGVIAWTRDWRLAADGEPSPATAAREAASDIGRVFGVMHARVRAEADRLAPGYRCLLSAADSLRKFELVQHVRVRDCLERSTADNPQFALAFGLLSFLYEREYLHDVPARFGERPALERSLAAAQRMLVLTPDSAVAHIALMENLYLRGDLAGAFAAGEKAISLNPVDPTIGGMVGLRFYFGGDAERGIPLLDKAAAPFGTNPSPIDFGLFCRAYMAGDLVAAARHAPRDDESTYPYGLAAQALIAAKAGERGRARRLLGRLRSLYPGWSDPRKMLARFIQAPAIVDRLATDLAAIRDP